MNGIVRTAFLCVAIFILSLSAQSVVAASSMSGNDRGIVKNRQGDITIPCPTRVSYRIESVSGWEAGFFGLKVLPFEDATVTGRMMNCNYSVNKGSARDSSMLTREMPAGYICKSERVYGAKNWAFICKRAVAPIKIKPKS